jgi:hypothetical protein
MRKTLRWAEDMLRRPGARLVLSHTSRANQRYAITPRGGAIRDDVAERLLREKPMAPCDRGLFPDTPQSWSLRS